ncbi:MAG TPA: hypothetical protein VHZ51_18755 [Ktedonobacteraceae bacterium]|jgi:cell division septum initiation protein DivIVA|nr:hypothetical protein [Ktedonobacteraceae bacterium]
MDILYLVDRLDNLIASSRRMPLVNQIILKEGDILSIVDQMRTSIPDEIKQARRIIQEKERILAQAQADAAGILARTREESERAMQREGLLNAAEKRSQEMVQKANQHALDIVQEAQDENDRLKGDADTYVTDTLRALHEHLLSIETEVGRTIMSIERGLDSMEAAPIDPEQPEVIEESDGPDGPDDSQQPQHPSPRRSSLAVDTMGGPNYEQ